MAWGRRVTRVILAGGVEGALVRLAGVVGDRSVWGARAEEIPLMNESNSRLRR